MISITEETNWNIRTSVQSIYRSMNTHIKHLAANSVEYSKVQQTLTSSLQQGSNSKIVIESIFEIKRPNETFTFNKHSLDNVKLLFHGSKVNNFLGILSRGILLPKCLLTGDDFLTRSDIGNLGYGIYFADDILTSVKYADASSSRNTRLIAVCEVALGKCARYFDYDHELTRAPDGFHSVHGVKTSDEKISRFQDNEYAIFDVGQYRIKYLVELQIQPQDGAIKSLSGKELLYEHALRQDWVMLKFKLVN